MLMMEILSMKVHKSFIRAFLGFHRGHAFSQALASLADAGLKDAD